jgi:hypothetical protein
VSAAGSAGACGPQALAAREIGWPTWPLAAVAAVTGTTFLAHRHQIARCGDSPLVDPAPLRDSGFVAGRGTAFPSLRCRPRHPLPVVVDTPTPAEEDLP